MSIEKVGKCCIGCLSCYFSCPVNAIEYSLNELNELSIKVNNSKCIKCKKCESTCPVLNRSLSSNPIQKIYCAFSSEEISRLSSSGGVFYVLAKLFLMNGWYVCGAIYSDDNRFVKHIITNNITEVEKMRGSKYIESNLVELYLPMDDILKNTKANVLFSGTPCQCAAIKSHYKQYVERIFFVEVICNGAMAPLVLDLEIDKKELEHKSKVVTYGMRYKKDSYLPLYARTLYANGYEDIESFYQTSLGLIYGSRIVLRECCYKCRFKGMNRVGDITIGDYHGFDIKEEIDATFGKSTVTANNEKGLSLINMLQERKLMNFYPAINKMDAIKNNSRLLICGFAPCRLQREKFKKIVSKYGIVKATLYAKKFYQKRYVIVRKILERIHIWLCLKK